LGEAVVRPGYCTHMALPKGGLAACWAGQGGVVMDPRAEGGIIRSRPQAFINRKGEAILVNTLDDKLCQRLIEMYLGYEPKNF